MRCSASPIICNGHKAIERSDAREVAAQFDAMLMQAAFAPLAKALGFYGDAVVGSVSRSVAEHEHGGLAASLERELALGGKR